MHFCGGLDDLIYLPLALLAMIPGIRYGVHWLRHKLGLCPHK